jgi:HNH endonuclease
MILQLGHASRNAGFITPPAVYLSNDNFLMGNCNMITQSELKEILHYNHDTGVFTRLVSTGNRVKVGEIAGYSMGCGYISIGVHKKYYLAHRLAWLYMTGYWPNDKIDHINHIRDDNRFCNLREVTHRENLMNSSMYKNNSSGITGVYWYKKYSMWLIMISIKGKQINLGYFVDKFEAICARKSAENKYGFHINHGK